MLRDLNRINLVLIVLIGGLCVFQWQAERNARTSINSLQCSVADHEQKFAKQEENLKSANENIERFRAQVTELKAQSVQVNPPTAQAGSPENHPDTIAISIDATGGIYLDKRPIGKNKLVNELTKIHAANPKTRVLITGDVDARHGTVITVLDRVRSAGIENVAFQVRDAESHTR